MSLPDDEELLSIRAAELYYDDDKTQDEVGAILGLTRWKVGRLLASAKEKGFIRIEIVHPRARKLSLERELTERFGLADAIVVPGSDNPAEVRTRIAQAAADYLTSMRPVPRRLGLSWGRTLFDVARALKDGWATGITVVQVNGGVTTNQRAGTAAATAVEIARKAGGQATLLPSPAIFERLDTKQSIVADRSVAAVMDAARDASAYLFTAGPAARDSALVDSGYLSAADIDILVARGAVGDVLGRFIDANGNIVDPSLNERTVGMDLEQLRAAATAIAVIGGREKHAVARAVVTSGLCSVLVTDQATALAILDRGDDEPH